MNKEKILSILKSRKTFKIGRIVLIVFVVLVALYFGGKAGLNYFIGDDGLAGMPCYKSGNTAVIEIRGEIVSYFVYTPVSDKSDSDDSNDAVSSEEVSDCIDNIRNDDGIKGVVVEIDSGGGSPFASEEIMNAIKGLNKPTVAVIREAGDSGAYLIASATNRIFASELSDVGGIGATYSYLDNSQQNIQNGLTFNQLSVGKFKDAGNPDKPLTAEEETLYMRDATILYQYFIKMVAENRGLDIEKVKQLADGSSMLGLQAKESGLIDEIGDINSAIAWLQSKIK